MNHFNDSFRKVDLHIHTPESLCYSQRSATPGEIVRAALLSGLEAIGITDHNTFQAIDDIREEAKRKGLTVFPGVELSTRGGHVIAIFNVDTPVGKIEDFLDGVGITRGGRGDAATLTGYGIEEVLQKIEEFGGLSVAAHIERWPSGFLETGEPRRTKEKIHSNKCLNALEITITQNKNLWNNGQVRGFPRKFACIQGSDAHAVVEIGRRPVYVQMETVNLSSLRAALLDYDTRIIFSNGSANVN